MKKQRQLKHFYTHQHQHTCPIFIIMQQKVTSVHWVATDQHTHTKKPNNTALVTTNCARERSILTVRVERRAAGNGEKVEKNGREWSGGGCEQQPLYEFWSGGRWKIRTQSSTSKYNGPWLHVASKPPNPEFLPFCFELFVPTLFRGRCLRQDVVSPAGRSLWISLSSPLSAAVRSISQPPRPRLPLHVFPLRLLVCFRRWEVEEHQSMTI